MAKLAVNRYVLGAASLASASGFGSSATMGDDVGEEGMN
jgi:hypothetical protein